MSKRKVVVTGLGVVSPLGCDLTQYLDALVHGRSGVRQITHFDASKFTTRIAGEVTGFNADEFISKKEQRRMDPFCHYGIAAAKLAVKDSGIAFDKTDTERVGVVLGTGIGGLQIMFEQSKVFVEKGPSRFSPFMIPQNITNIVAGYVAIEFGLKGPNFVTTSACAASIHSLGESLRIIQSGEADVMLAGGTEAPICELGVGGFCAMRALSTRNDNPAAASRPFDRGRDGFVCAEGAGVLVLEEFEHAKKRGARIYAELAGYGRTCDAYHITAPHSEGEGAGRSMELAMKDAGVTPAQIDYVNGHATSTELGDIGETLAIKRSLGEHAKRVMVSATKSMIGHGLGAAGGLESVALCLMMQKGIVHPTINLEDPDPRCDLDYVPGEAREAKLNVCLKNSFGFGGHNASLCFKSVA